MNILVTGANGFIGQNLVDWLTNRDGCNIITHTRSDSLSTLDDKISQADFVFHLAGVNRPKTEDDLQTGNVQLTELLCESLSRQVRSVPVVFSSSTQAIQNNPYGISKLQAEERLRQYAGQCNARVSIYRLAGVFGKWSRPNYNTVVATFCHNIARDLPIQISDPNHQVALVYIDDVIQHFLSELELGEQTGVHIPTMTPVHHITLGNLAEKIQTFRQGRDTVYAPGFDEPFTP